MKWQPVTAGYPPDGQIVLTKVKARDRLNRFTKFLVRRDGAWFTENDRKVGWHPTHWQVAEPEDAAAARLIVYDWENPIEATPEKYARWLRARLHGNARWNWRAPALKIVNQTPPMPELAPRGKAVAP